METKNALFLLVSLFAATAVAEDTPRGRLADGRAYRTDENGIQLVDYIAELEVNAEAMNRRIVGLEDELAEKQRIIERFSRGDSGSAALAGALTERTIAGRKLPVEQRGDSTASDRAKADIARLERENGDLRAEQERARTVKAGEENEVARLRTDLQSARTELATERRLRDQDQATYAAVSRECAALRTSAKPSCDAEVARAVQLSSRESIARESALHEELQAAQVASASDLAAVQRRVTDLAQELADAKTEVDAVRRTLAATEADLTGARSALAAAAARPVVRAEPAQASGTTTVVAAVRPVRDYAARSRLAVVDSLRGSMLSDLNQVRSLVVTRDNLFSRAVGRGDQRIQFKPSPLLSTKRRTLDDIGAGIRGAEQVHELTELRTDLAEIRALVQDDIDLLRRTGRVG